MKPLLNSSEEWRLALQQGWEHIQAFLRPEWWLQHANSLFRSVVDISTLLELFQKRPYARRTSSDWERVSYFRA